MPRPRPLYVEQQITRHGRKIWYFRKSRHEPRQRLPDVYGTEEFMTAYRACLAGERVAGDEKRKASRGTVKWLIGLYRLSRIWTHDLEPATRKARGHILDRMVERVGSGDVEDLIKEEMVKNMEAKRETPHQANLMLTTVKRMFDWAMGAGHVEGNPCDGIPYFRTKKRGFDPDADGIPSWSEDDIAKFEGYWPLGTPERLLFSVLLFTGLRIGDATVLGRQHVQRDGTIKLRNEKTGTVVYLDILPPLREALAAGPKAPPGQLGFVTWKRGGNVGKEHLGAEFIKAAKEVGLENRSAHGLRKAAARRLAEEGKSVNELMAIFGWVRPDMAIYYTREADKKRMALRAMAGLVRAQIKNVYSLTDLFGEGFGGESQTLSIA
jgi:integrase